MAKTIAICNQKGGVGKTTTALNLGVGLVREGQRVLLIDGDPQSDLTSSLGYNPDELDKSLGRLMYLATQESRPDVKDTILHHSEGVDIISELLGKETIDTNTYGKSTGRNGNYSTNYQNTGRELLTPDEVRMLDNRYALLFIRGERPVMDFKFDILKHPSVRLTTDGQADPYIHGEPWDAGSSIELVSDPKLIADATANAKQIELTDTNYVLLSEEDVENEINNEKDKKEVLNGRKEKQTD